MESRMTELMEAIQESEGQAERRVLTLLGGRCISEKALVIDGKIVWESRKNGYFHGYTDEIKNITESGITYIGNEKDLVFFASPLFSLPEFHVFPCLS